MTINTASSPDLPQGEVRQRVMYIDDDDALVELTTRILQRRGYVVEGFTQPEQAIEAFQSDPARIDVVVTDFSMPRMSGLDLARALLAIRANTCIVLTSGYVDDALLKRSHTLGVRDVIYKTSTAKEFCESLHRVLQTCHGVTAS
jgi:two-component system, cell cycle sensor histidine kinase and response regulator CckA